MTGLRGPQKAKPSKARPALEVPRGRPVKKPTHQWLWSLARECVFLRDGKRCRVCKKTPDDGVVIQVHHVIPKGRWGAGRYNLLNLVALCGGHHLFGAHSTDARQAAAFVVEIVGQGLLDHLDMLRATSRRGRKRFDAHATRLYLESELQRLRGAA